MTHHTISARDANQQFSRLLRQVEEEGEEVTITRRGTPVARLVPADGASDRSDRAWANVERLMEEGFEIGSGRFDRESLYDR
ncbi:type II toxin-antitoxin system prevent-host-death family antitoxin [Caenispirillum bisanense]|uniref:type II toxin-antitoxin system Phd/YefM family antitoxin n=1 Tax=Caenispirillum bisanense TaxID=414052 RepID=UPI0031D89FFF